MDILSGSGLLGSGPTGPGSGFSVMPTHCLNDKGGGARFCGKRLSRHVTNHASRGQEVHEAHAR